ncbi:hypothetical protein [Rhizobium halophytocola]|uniref:Uncharacterized protein n=1 Tax=Rhizobium halophytocola TaxID=735519 RepID=A0ABS4E2G9_9HYPH|nr:hypothetical protein [Rhizobium halophytocola]MBP1852146.1 hypothetical protein [Rhizobium halophytocola]
MRTEISHSHPKPASGQLRSWKPLQKTVLQRTCVVPGGICTIQVSVPSITMHTNALAKTRIRP